jgi:propanol-preferring alcohol dehydrogenase
MDWPEGQLPWKLPFTLGHENAGRIEKCGPGVNLTKGDAFLIYGPWGCGACHTCRLGRENYCERAAEISVSGGGLGADGGMAAYMLVPDARFLVALGELDPVSAAPLTDAGLTPYHAIATSREHLFPGSTAVVIGCGGLGQMGVQLLKVTTGTRVIAVDTDERKLQTARSLGADILVRSDANTASAIRKATNEVGADVVFDMVGSDATLAMGARALRSEGRLVIIGLADGTLDLSFFTIPYGAQVATSYWGTLPELMELVALARAKKVKLEVETYPLAQAVAVYDKLRRGEIKGRAVIVP